MFEQASRMALRFETNNGLGGFISTEDLWNLPLTSKSRVSLDGIAKDLHRQLKDSEEVSFVTPSAANEELQLKFDIVKHIIDTIVAERKAASKAPANKAQKERLMGILAQKQEAALQDMSEEDLKKMIAEL